MPDRRALSTVSGFFLRVLAALLLVNLVSAGVLISIALRFSSDSLTSQTRETITQQVSVYAEDLGERRIGAMLTLLNSLESSQDMEDYLQASTAERLIFARRLERQFIQRQKDNGDVVGLYYFDRDGQLATGVREKLRLIVDADSDAHDLDSVLPAARPIFQELLQRPLLLSSGNEERLVPPREVIVDGPLARGSKGYSLLAGLAELDKKTGLFGGMLLAHYSLDNWFADLARVRIQDQSPVWVYADNGERLLQPTGEVEQGEILDPVPVLPSGMQTDTRVIEAEAGLVALRDIPLGKDGRYLRLVFSVPSALLNKGLEPAIEFFSWVLAGSVISLILLSYFLTRLLVRPFNELDVARNRLVTAQRLARIGHWEWHGDTRTIGLSENAITLLGLPPGDSQLPIERLLEMVYEEDRRRLEKLIDDAVATGRSASLDYRLTTADGRPVFIHHAIDVIDRDTSRIIGTVQDITERRNTEARIRELAYSDSVTGLANRSLLDEIAESALRTARRRNKRMAVVFLDLDQFKRVNDTLGHDTGDELLRQVASRLLECVRPSETLNTPSDHGVGDDVVARLGGDEFVILLSHLNEAKDAVIVADRIQQALTRPFHVNDREILSGGSMGISIFPDHAETVTDLMRLADTAMYYAKSHGRNRYMLYNPHIDAQHRNRLSIEVAMSRALDNDEFELYYQPRYAIDGQTIVSFEALLRWTQPDKGMIMPDQFIYIAEENGSIVQIGEWVVRTACRQLCEWQRRYARDLRISVNISPVQFLAQNLVSNIDRIIRESGIDAGSLELELTEGALFEDVETGVRKSQQLKQLGLSLSIDDFGTGYSSLQLLSQLPVDTLKIDKSFVQNMLTKDDDEMIVQSFLLLAKNLELKVVAEGVEELGQWLMLKERGCNEVQGYLFSKPLPVADAENLLIEHYQVQQAL